MKNRCSIFILCLFTILSGLYSSGAHAVSIELKPPSNYDTWRPTNTDKITFTVIVDGLHDSSEGFSEGAVTLSFSEVSEWVGICMNAPQSGAESDPDLRFYPKDQSKLSDGLEWDPENWNRLVGDESIADDESVRDSVGVKFDSDDNLSGFTFSITVRCEDYGAYGILVATLVDASDDTRRWLSDKTVPKDTNGDYIADSWKKDEWDGGSGHILQNIKEQHVRIRRLEKAGFRD